MLSKIIFAFLFVTIANPSLFAQSKKDQEVCYNPNAIKDTSKRSIKSAAVGNIGSTKVVINYHSPGVRKRIIWGGLVPYDEVWVTGAHDATNIEIDKPFIVAGKIIPKGKYAIFTIPGKNEWTVILNKKWDQHLANEYDAKEDVVRFKVKPVRQVKNTERLQYFIKSLSANKGTIAVAWEKLKIEFPIVVRS